MIRRAKMRPLLLAGLTIAGIISTAVAGISGEIVNGLRVLSNQDINSKNITLYRGDYVVFPVAEGESRTLEVKGLDINQAFPSKEKDKSYVKFKKTGEYDYTYGQIKGKITVIEYEQPNYHAVNAQQAKEIITNISPLIIDVRTPQEFAQGYIEGAMLLPVQNIQREYGKIADYKDKPVLIYCATGNRSTVAAKILIDNGFKNIYNMLYGIAEWEKNGYPVVKESANAK
jgi:rhodanese-related sulfurtransferase